MKFFEWFESVFQGLGNMVTAPIDGMKDWIAGKIADGLIEMMERVEPESVGVVRDLMKKMAATPDLSPEYKTFFNMFEQPKKPAWFALAPIAAALLAYPAISAASAGAMEEVRQSSFAQFRPSLLDPTTLYRAKWRGLVDDKFIAQELGWLGYDDARQAILEPLAMFYPAPQDLIRFAVRDTFQEATVKKYGYDDNYPEAINEYAIKAGMSPDWLKHYWRAHWELPSPTQMYEMLHRGKITMDDARNLLKIADVAPYFIEPMLAISYNPYTRVDIRRMYAEGVLSKDEVLKAHKELGYDDEKAKKLTDFVTKEGMTRERDLSLSQLIDAYTEGEVTAAAATESLIKLGYDKDEAALVLKLEDNKIERALRKREKAILVTQYSKGLIKLSELEKGLDTLKLSEREKKVTIAEAKLKVKEAVSPKPK